MRGIVFLRKKQMLEHELEGQEELLLDWQILVEKKNGNP